MPHRSALIDLVRNENRTQVIILAARGACYWDCCCANICKFNDLLFERLIGRSL